MRGRNAATRAVYPRWEETETKRKSAFWACADQALHTSEQDWRSLRSEEGGLTRSKIRRTISVGNRGTGMTKSWFEISTARAVWVSAYSSDCDKGTYQKYLIQGRSGWKGITGRGEHQREQSRTYIYICGRMMYRNRGGGRVIR